MRLNLLTFNIAHGRGPGIYQGFTRPRKLRQNMEAIAKLLKESNADVVALQEVDEESHWHRGVRLMETLCEYAEFPCQVMGINTLRTGPKPLSYGNALLSRFPVMHWQNQPFGTATLGEKGFLYTELALNDDTLLPVVNLHLDYRSRQRRVVQVERLVDYLRSRPRVEGRLHHPPIVCGDFNAGSQKAQDAVQHLFEHLIEDDNYQVFPEDARTFPSYWPRKGIDFIFVPGRFKVHEHRVIRTLLSDHCPVMVSVDIPDEQADRKKAVAGA